MAHQVGNESRLRFLYDVDEITPATRAVLELYRKEYERLSALEARLGLSVAAASRK